MSLRRKSCSACFRGRRKCNLAYPTCDTCLKTKKNCQYAYPPFSSPKSSDDSIPTGAGPLTPYNNNSLGTLIDDIDNSTPGYLETGAFSDLFDQYTQFPEHGSATSLVLPDSPTSLSSIARFVGSLGEAQPIQGSTQSWRWVFDELKSYPSEFAQRTHTIFIHRQLYRDAMPQVMRTAFGVSSASCLISDTNRTMMFRVVDAEVLELLKPSNPTTTTLLEDLARLQALVLYQTIRFSHGDITHRIIAEQQQGVLMTRALKLLARSQSEIPDQTTSRHTWIVAECIRRTVIVVYMIYGMNSIFQDGICIGLHTLAKLPLSTALTSWDSEWDSHLKTGGTIPYETFVSLWLVSTPRMLDPFEKLLLVPCRGLDSVEMYNDSAVSAVSAV